MSTESAAPAASNLPLGALAGPGAAIAGAAIWAAITAATFGVAGAVLALLGCALGNLLTITWFLAQEDGASFFSVLTSLDLGLVNRVVPDELLMKETRALGLEIAANAPLAVQASKRMMRMGLSEEFPDHVHHVYLQLIPLFSSKDFREGVTSYVEKRAPNWRAR